MSTKSKAPDGAAFKQSLWTVAGILGALCLIFIVLNLLQPPRLRRAEIDHTSVVRQPNQRLVMYANQPLASVKESQITIEPKTGFAASVNGEALLVQFDRRLLYNTTYTITVRDVSSRHRKHNTSLFRYSFKTADPTLYFIRRNPEIEAESSSRTKKPDEIIQTTLEGTEQTTVFRANKIQDYVLLGDNIVVNTINEMDGDDYTNSLFLINPKTQKSEQLLLPNEGTITQLHTSPNQRLIGYSFTSKYDEVQKYRNILFNVDMAANRLLYSINGLDNKPIQVMDWQFAPDGTTIIAQTYDTNLLLIDTIGQNKPLPLGQFTTMSNFSYNGAKLIAYDKTNGPVTIDLLAHNRMPLSNTPANGLQPYIQNARLLSNDDGYIKQTVLYELDAKAYSQYLVINRNNSEKIIYKGSQTHTQLGSYNTSTNDQYVAAEVYSTGINSTNDNYSETPKQTNTQTQIINLQDGKTIKSINGFKVMWN